MNTKKFLYERPHIIISLILLYGVKELVKAAGLKSFASLMVKYKIYNAYLGEFLMYPLKVPCSTFPEEVHDTYKQLVDIYSSDRTIAGGNDFK